MNPPDALAPEIYRQFAGYETLTGFFGYWPGFQDAEVLSLLLDCGEPTAVLRLHAFEWAQEEESGRTVLAHHCTVEFRFTQVDDLHLAGFDTHNIISGLRIALEGRESPPRWLVALPALRGLDGQFTCGVVAVAAVTPGIPPGSIYEK